MKILLFVFGLVLSNECYSCQGNSLDTSKESKDCFDDTKLNNADYKCTYGSVCVVGRWERTNNEGGTINFIERGCSSSDDAKNKLGKSNCNDLKIEITDAKHEACWAVCDGPLCNGTREVLGSLVLMGVMMIVL